MTVALMLAFGAACPFVGFAIGFVVATNDVRDIARKLAALERRTTRPTSANG